VGPLKLASDRLRGSAPMGAAPVQAWAVIRSRHPDLPRAVVVPGPGRSGHLREDYDWGDFAAMRWADGTAGWRALGGR